MEVLEKKAYFNELFVYYQPLLTEKQQEIFEDYYANDFSLGEIAENNNISRNAVFDTIKKVEKLLENYENKLQLVKKDHLLNQYLNELTLETTNKGLLIIQKIKEME